MKISRGLLWSAHYLAKEISRPNTFAPGLRDYSTLYNRNKSFFNKSFSEGFSSRPHSDNSNTQQSWLLLRLQSFVNRSFTIIKDKEYQVVKEFGTVLGGIAIVVSFPVSVWSLSDSYQKMNRVIEEERQQRKIQKEKFNIKYSVDNVIYNSSKTSQDSSTKLIKRYALDILVNELRAERQTCESLQDGKVVIIAITGREGTGKTQLVRDYAEYYGTNLQKSKVQESKTFFCIRASNTSSLEMDYRELARQLRIDGEKTNQPIEKIIDYVNGCLSLRPGWVLIFDNVENYNDIEIYIPKKPGSMVEGSVIITSQREAILFGQRGSTISLKAGLINTKQHSESTQLLRLVSGKKDINEDELKTLADRLGNLPIALQIAAVCLKNMDVKDYLKKFIEMEEKLRKENSSMQSDELIRNTVALLSLKTFKENFANKPEIDLLKIITHFSSDYPLPLSILSTFNTQDVQTQKIFAELLNYGYIDYCDIATELGSRQDGIIIHNLVNNKLFKERLYDAFFGDQSEKNVETELEPKETKQQNQLKCLEYILKDLSLDNTTESSTRKNQLLIPHAERLLDDLEKQNNISESLGVTIIRCHSMVANCYFQAGMYIQAKSHLEKAKDRCIKYNIKVDEFLNINNSPSEPTSPKDIAMATTLAQIDKKLPSIFANLMHYYGKTLYHTVPLNNRVEESGKYLKTSLALRKVIDECQINKATPPFEDIDNADGYATLNFERAFLLNEIEAVKKLKIKLSWEDIDPIEGNPTFNFERMVAKNEADAATRMDAVKLKLESIKDEWNPLHKMIIRRYLVERIYIPKGDYDNAMKYANEAVQIMEDAAAQNDKLYKDAGHYYNMRAALHAKCGHLAESQKDYEKAEKCSGEVQRQVAKEGKKWTQRETCRHSSIAEILLV